MQYDLKTPFEYGVKGEVVTAQFITLKAPNFNQFVLAAPIKQAFIKAATEINTDGAESAGDTSGEIDAQAAMQLMATWSGDLGELLKKAAKLFVSGVAKIDGEAKLTDALISKMSGDDFEALLGEYIANFIYPSLTGR